MLTTTRPPATTSATRPAGSGAWLLLAAGSFAGGLALMMRVVTGS